MTNIFLAILFLILIIAAILKKNKNQMFKVICKADRNNWESLPRSTKIVTTYRLFGLIKTTRVVSDPNKVPGPQKEEICIVTNVSFCNNEKYYTLAGYPYGGYDAKYFVMLNELTEMQSEMAEKSKHVLN